VRYQAAFGRIVRIGVVIFLSAIHRFAARTPSHACEPCGVLFLSASLCPDVLRDIARRMEKSTSQTRQFVLALIVEGFASALFYSFAAGLHICEADRVLRLLCQTQRPTAP
jgi:hypothetical protein